MMLTGVQFKVYCGDDCELLCYHIINKERSINKLK